MKHNFDAPVTVKVEIPTQDLTVLVDKVQDAAISIIFVATVASIVNAAFTSRGKHGL